MEQRIIKFKAKRLGTGEWMEGDLLHHNNRCYIGIHNVGRNIVANVPIEVDPSTVCQFTGMKDREGNDIYEHDLLAKDETETYKVGFVNYGFAASYKNENDYSFNIIALSKCCRVYGNEFDRKVKNEN